MLEVFKYVTFAQVVHSNSEDDVVELCIVGFETKAVGKKKPEPSLEELGREKQEMNSAGVDNPLLEGHSVGRLCMIKTGEEKFVDGELGDRQMETIESESFLSNERSRERINGESQVINDQCIDNAGFKQEFSDRADQGKLSGEPRVHGNLCNVSKHEAENVPDLLRQMDKRRNSQNEFLLNLIADETGEATCV